MGDLAKRSLVLALLVAGCDVRPGMGNADIIKDVKLCESAGLNADAIRRGNSPTAPIVQVQCAPIVGETKIERPR